MNSGYCAALQPEDAARLFPFYMAFRPDLTLAWLGPWMALVCPEMKAGDSLLEHFRIDHPKSAQDFESLIGHHESLVVLAHRSGKFHLRGPVLHLAEADLAGFFGFPWTIETGSATGLGAIPTSFGAPAFTLSNGTADVAALGELKTAAPFDLLGARPSGPQAAPALTPVSGNLDSARRATSELVANISGELQTPIKALIGLTGLLLETALTREQAGFVEAIRNSGHGLLNVASHLHELSKIESGHVQVEARPFALDEAIEDVLKVHAPQAFEKGLELAYRVLPQTPLNLVGDAGRLRQILASLVGNAIKFTDHGGVLITVDADPAAVGPVLLRFAVEDTGTGIAPSRRDRLFEGSSPAGPAGLPEPGVTGLGLAVSKRLVELMGGALSVESSPGQGSIFRFSVLTRAAELGRTIEVHPKLAGRSAMVLAGSRTFRLLAEHYLPAWGMRLNTEESPALLEQRLRSNAPDVLLVDADHRDLDAVGFARLRFELPQSVPVIVLHRPGWKPHTMIRDVNGTPGPRLLQKPVQPAVIREEILAALHGEEAEPTTVARQVLDSTLGSRLPMRVLIAEDHPVNQKMTQLMLAKCGYRADVVANGREALDAVERRGYDLVLMDIQMPEMDGIEAARRIRSCGDRIAQPRIVAMTANATSRDREACLSSGMDDFLAKPVRPEDVREVLERSATSPAKSAAAALDPDLIRLLQETTGGDVAAFNEIFDIYLSEARITVREMLAARAQGDVAVLRKKAHYLKGSSGMVGATGVSELCRQIESASGENAATDDSRLASLEEALSEVERTAQHLVKSGQFGSDRELAVDEQRTHNA